MPNDLYAIPPAAADIAADQPPSYDEAMRHLQQSRDLTRDFDVPVGFADPRYADIAPTRLYPAARALQWPSPLQAGSLQPSIDRYDRLMLDPGLRCDEFALDSLYLLSAIAALAPGPGLPRMQGLLQQDMIDRLSLWIGGAGAIDLQHVHLRKQVLVIEYVRLLAHLVGSGEMDPEHVLQSLAVGKSDHAPSLLMGLASAAATDANMAMALCDLFCACGERRRGRPEFQSGLVRSWLSVQDGRGLPRGAKYDTFYGRVFSDGRIAGRPGALIVAYRLGRLDLLPTQDQVAAAHSWTRVGKWEAAFHDGEAWGGGQSQGPQGEWSVASAAVRLYRRAYVDVQWCASYRHEFETDDVVPADRHNHPMLRTVWSRLRSLRGDPRNAPAH